jgi:tetratricopeptide (TPR) repeat protein
VPLFLLFLVLNTLLFNGCTKKPLVATKKTVDYFNEGEQFFAAGKYEEAIVNYNKAIELDPQYAVAYYNRGNAYHKLGQDVEAIVNYNKAIELNPKDAAAYYNRGVAYAILSEGADQANAKELLKKAKADIDHALKMEPQNQLFKETLQMINGAVKKLG